MISHPIVFSSLSMSDLSSLSINEYTVCRCFEDMIISLATTQYEKQIDILLSLIISSNDACIVTNEMINHQNKKKRKKNN